jgi:hypothetical protein
MKTEIIKYLETDRSYRGGVSLVIKYSPKLGLKKQLNVHPQSDYLKGCIMEELRELAGLKEAELKVILSKAVVIPSKEVKPVTPVESDISPLKADHEYLSRFPTPEIKPTETRIPASAPAKKISKTPTPIKKPSRKR